MTLIQAIASDVLDAAVRLHEIAVRTPLLTSSRLNELAGGKVFVKIESLQHTGAFKFRGAFNCMSQLERSKYPNGVLAYSTGNHGQAIATVGKMLGIATTVVMPSDAPTIKIEKARRQGANVVLFDRTTENREAIAAVLNASGGYALVPPGDHHQVIAGQGTAALEAFQQLGRNRADLIVVPCGGGGLSAGTCLAVEALHERAHVWAAEPEAFDDTRRSLLSGVRETNPTGAVSVCDALQAPTPAELPFSINARRLKNVVTANDAQVMHAMKLLFEEFRVAVEPGGAVALAALLGDRTLLGGRTAVVIASGGNVDPQIFWKAIA